MYIHIQSVYNGIMPITLTQLEDKVISAAQQDRPGDIKGIIRAVSYVMGTLTRPYSHEKLQAYNVTQTDRNCVQDYIDSSDDIDLATFYDLCYLSRQVDALEASAYEGRSSIGWGFTSNVERATRCIIDGQSLYVAIMLLTERDVVDTLPSGYSPASYWAPANNYRFGETFTYKDAHQLAFFNSDTRDEILRADDVDTSVVKSVPSSDLVDVLSAVGRPELVINRKSSHESVLQAQKRWVLESKSANDLLLFLSGAPLFVSRFMRDDEILKAFKKRKNNYRYAAALYLATIELFDLYKDEIKSLRNYLLDPENASKEDRRISLTQFDIPQLVSMLHFMTALDDDAISFLNYRFSELHFSSVGLKTFVMQKSSDKYKNRASLTESELEVRIDTHDIRDVNGGYVCDIIKHAHSIVEYFTPDVISSLLQEDDVVPTKENTRESIYHYPAKSPAVRRMVLDRRLDELV